MAMPPLLHSIRSLLLLGAMLALAACSDAPRLEVMGATVIDDQSPDMIVVAVHINATNPNEKPLPLKIVGYSVSIAGGPSDNFTGTRSAEATLPAMSVHRLVLPAVVARPAAGVQPGGPVSISGKLEYVSETKLSEVAYDLGFGWATADFSGSGAIGPPPPMPPPPAAPPPLNPPAPIETKAP